MSKSRKKTMKGQKPVYFEFSDEQIEAMPEDIRNELRLEVSPPPMTLGDWVGQFLTELRESSNPSAEFNIKDLQYYIWRETGEFPNQASVRSAIYPLLKISLAKGGVYRVKERRYYTFKAEREHGTE